MSREPQVTLSILHGFVIAAAMLFVVALPAVAWVMLPPAQSPAERAAAWCEDTCEASGLEVRETGYDGLGYICACR